MSGAEIYQATRAEAVDISSTDHSITGGVDNDNFGTLYVGGSGDVIVITKGGDTVTFSSVPAGAFLPVLITTVVKTGTTATNMVAMWK